MDEQLLHADITSIVLKAFFHVYDTLGYGFLEKIYENALVLTLKKWGVMVAQQQPIKVHFEGEQVGDYFADLIIGDRVIAELKSAKSIDPAHEAQLLNYLKATRIEVGLLLNFGLKAQFRRKLFTNDLK